VRAKETKRRFVGGRRRPAASAELALDGAPAPFRSSWPGGLSGNGSIGVRAVVLGHRDQPRQEICQLGEQSLRFVGAALQLRDGHGEHGEAGI